MPGNALDELALPVRIRGNRHSIEDEGAINGADTR